MGLVYISSVTASASATVEFTTGIDATYNEYQFHFVNIHPTHAQGYAYFSFQVNASGQTGFNEVITSTAFVTSHNEADTTASVFYDAPYDQAQGTGYQFFLDKATGTGADEAVSGILTLYDPSSTTYVKHFVSKGSGAYYNQYAVSMYNAGYINTTAAIDEISFKFNVGNIGAGTIHMYGVG